MTEDSIAIVGMGCVLPDAENPNKFWHNCLEGKSAIRPISQHRWDSSLYLTNDRSDIDKTYSVLAGEIDHHIYFNLKKKFYSAAENENPTRMELLLLEALAQASLNIKKRPDDSRIAFVLGAMSPDERHYLVHSKEVDQKLLNFISENLSDEDQSLVQKLEVLINEKEGEIVKSWDGILTSEILEKVMQRYGIGGAHYIVDAACASSLASLDLCCEYLKTRKCDLAFAAGAETNLSPGSFSLFSRVGGLADTVCLPFDQKSRGLVQGEGAGILALKRLRDAELAGDKIYAVINSVGGSSDGKTSSLFQPNNRGQVLAFSRAYETEQDKNIIYLEGHGTGTTVGDRTELFAAAEYFKDQPLQVGSVKALTGHTKAAAGVANLIKSIYILNEKLIPGLRYISQPVLSTENLKLIKESQPLPEGKSNKVGVSAFGFGGSNYHAVVEAYAANEPQSEIKKEKNISEVDVYVIAEAELAFDDYDSSWFTNPDSIYRLPPQSLPYIDKAQLLAVRTAELAIRESKLGIDDFPNNEVAVISTSYLGLEIVEEQATRVRSTMLEEAVKKYVEHDQKSKVVELIKNYRNRVYPFSEDSAAGVLNNVIAGRVCHAFDFHGASFNIESRHNVLKAATEVAQLLILRKNVPVVFLVEVKEIPDETNYKVKRKSVKCRILCTDAFIKNNFIKPKYKLDPSDYTFKNTDKVLLNTNKAIVAFPGQGSISPNRYVNYISYSEVFKKRFEEADRIAAKLNLPSISSVAREDARLDEQSYPNTNDAMMRNLFQYTVEVTLFDLLLKRGIEPSILISHSFGEYAALCCAGIISFEDGLKIVKIREEISPAPGTAGTLVALGISEEKFKSLNLQTECFISNVNSKNQIVLSVSIDQVQALLTELRSRRVAARELKSVARPYHSILMGESAKKFKLELNKLNVHISSSKYDFVSSVGANLISANSKITRDQLVNICAEQLVQPVLFDLQLTKAFETNQSGFIELGLDSTLCAFAKSNSQYKNTQIVKTAEELLLKKMKSVPSKVFKLKSNKYVEMVSKIVSSVTGYKIEEITLEHQFEEDLRIDSIKKAEIFFRCLEETQNISNPSIEVSNFKQVGDVIEFLQQNESLFKTNHAISEKPQFKLFNLGFTHSLTFNAYEKNNNENQKTIKVLNIDKLHTFSQADIAQAVSDLLGEQPPVATTIALELNIAALDLASEMAQFLLNLNHLILSLVKNIKMPEIILSSQSDSPMFNGCRSFLKSLQYELEGFNFKTMLTHSSAANSNLHFNESKFWDSDLSIEDEDIKSLSLIEKKSDLPMDKNKELVIFSIGGAKGILNKYFSNMDDCKNIQLFFTGRSSPEDTFVVESIEKFNQKFKKVNYIQLDASDSTQLGRAIDNIVKACGSLDVVIDASGAEVSKLFEHKTYDEIQYEIESKYLVRRNLKNSLEKLSLQPKSIFFNSIVSHFGNHGQSVYAFTNSYVSKFSKGIHLYWPPLDGVGMTEDKGILMKLKLSGLDLLPANEINKYLDLFVFGEILDGDFVISTLKMNFQLNMMSWPKEIVSGIFGKISNQHNFSVKNLDKQKAPYLQDHVVNNNCIAPGSMGLATFSMAGKSLFGRLPNILNFEMQNFILLDRGPIDLTTSIQFRESHDIFMKMFSKFDNYETYLNNTEEFNFTDIGRIADFSIEREFELSEFYSKKFIDYGPSFRVLNTIGVSPDNKIIAQVDLDKISRTKINEYDRLTTLYEACIQAAATKCLLETRGLALPTGVVKIYHANNLNIRPEKIYVTTSDLVDGAEPNNFSVDVTGYDIFGRPIIFMKSVKLKKFVQLSEFPLVVKNLHKIVCQ